MTWYNVVLGHKETCFVLLQGAQVVDGAVQEADAQQYAAVLAASSALAPSEPAAMHPGMTEAYQLPVRACGHLCIKRCHYESLYFGSAAKIAVPASLHVLASSSRNDDDSRRTHHGVVRSIVRHCVLHRLGVCHGATCLSWHGMQKEHCALLCAA